VFSPRLGLNAPDQYSRILPSRELQSQLVTGLVWKPSRFLASASRRLIAVRMLSESGQTCR
jgi:hypothetical protein